MNKKSLVFAVALLSTASIVNAAAVTPAAAATTGAAASTATTPAVTPTTGDAVTTGTAPAPTVKDAFYKVFYNTVKENKWTALTCFVAGALTVEAVRAFSKQATAEDTEDEDNN